MFNALRQVAGTSGNHPRMRIMTLVCLGILLGFAAAPALAASQEGGINWWNMGMQLFGGLAIFLFVTGKLERRFFHESEEKKAAPHPGWMGFQWASTGFLWSMWLIQDLANVFCYLPREITATGLALSLGGMALLQGYLIYKGGGKIQGIVTAKTNTLDVRSATFIDFFYGVVLLFFKMDILGIFPAKMPMSTTWVFLGLLAGREIGIAIQMRHRSAGKVSQIIFSDAGKALIGSVVSVALALALPFLASKFTPNTPEPVSTELSE